MGKDYLYRAQILERPEFEEYEAFDDRWPEQGRHRVVWQRPVGWVASPDYIERYKSNKFFEPSTERWYKSRSSAKDRVDLLNGMGYRAIVQRSAPVVWPVGSAQRVAESEALQAREALRVLKRAGLITSADEILLGKMAA